MAKRKIIYGKDWLTDIKFDHLNKGFPIYYWDVWVVIALESNLCEGSWDTLIDLIRENKTKSYGNQRTYEQVRSQILFFKNRLETHQLKATDVFDKLKILYPDPDFLKRHIKYAQSKLLGFRFKEKDKTKAMLFTPRVLKTEASLRGNLQTYWDGNEEGGDEDHPLEYITTFEKKFKSSGYYNKHQSWDVEVRLEKLLKKLAKKANIFSLFAIYRAFLTVIIEKTNMIDDSFGVIGDLTRETFKAYISLDKSQLVIPLEDFYWDLLNLMLWEDYGYFDECYQDVFENLTDTEIPIVEEILLMEKEELKKEELDYQKNVALNFLALLYSQHTIFDKFVPLAKEVGTKSWMPIDTLAKAAEKHQRKNLAIAVYQAALKDESGFHYDSLKKKYEDLLARVS